MKFLDVAKLFERVESVSSRTEMSGILAEFVKSLDSEEVQILSYMIQGRVAPMFVDSEFNYSEKSFITLLKQYFKGLDKSVDVEGIRSDKGDIGDTVLEVWDGKSKGLSLVEVYTLLWDVVNIKGEGSVSRKNKLIIDTLSKMEGVECKYFVRIVCGDLRLGLNTRTLLEVFSFALVGDKGLKGVLDDAFGVSADIGYIAKVCFEGDDFESDLRSIECTPGIPVLSRLVERVGSFDEVFERLGESVLMQPKFDGLRCQIHKWKGSDVVDNGVVWNGFVKKEGGDLGLFGGLSEGDDINVRLFTRNLEDVTEMFPEIVDAAKLIPVDSFVLDSEVVGWNYEKDTFLSYQETMQRRRKYSVGQKSEEIPVRAMVFDVLYLEGGSMIGDDTKERIEVMEERFTDTSGGIVLAETVIADDIDGLNKYFNDSVDGGLEGVIVKQFGGGYKPGFRNFEWIKLKKSMDKALVDTVDLVVVGFYKGSGRRAEFGLGAVLGAVYNKEGDCFDAISKIGTGMSDELLKEMFESLNGDVESVMPSNVRCDDVLVPDFWVTPKYVISVEADEITKNISDSRGEIGGGMSLRFPRLIEFGRDKNALDTTSIKELERMYEISKNN